MTKKDYQIIAAAISDFLSGSNNRTSRIHLHTFTTLHLMPKLKEENSRFDVDKFLKAALY